MPNPITCTDCEPTTYKIMTQSNGSPAGSDRSELRNICVVAHPIGSLGETAARQLLGILSALTTVSLMTAAVPEASPIRDDHEVIDISESNTGESIVVAGVRFVVNQCRMCRELVRRDEEIVLFYGATSYLLPILCSRLLGKTVILEPRGDVPLTLRLHWEQRAPEFVARLLAGTLRLVEQTGYRLSDAIITYTPEMARELGLDRYGAKLYPNGARYVDTDRFEPRVPFHRREQNVGFLGRLDEEKNIRTLAQVATELPEDVTFRFVGDGNLSGWLRRELAEEIERDDVEVVGWIDHDEVPEELNRLRLLVLPSEPTEGLPTVILESLACGTPVYATPVSGVPDVVRDGETGFLMGETEATAIRDDISAILDRPDLADVSAEGRELIRDEYSFEAAVERYRSILSGLTDGE